MGKGAIRMSRDEIIIHIDDRQQICVEIKENGIIQAKNIDAKTLTACLTQGIIEIEAGFSSGFLPEGTIWIEEKKGLRRILLEYASPTVNWRYGDILYEGFPLPRLLFGFCLTNIGRICHMAVGIPDSGELSMDTAMFLWPFSNVYRDNQVCLGNNTLPLLQSLTHLQDVARFFLTLPNNNDLYVQQNNRPGLPYPELLHHLKDKDRQYYYDHILVPSGATLQQFLGGLRNG